MNARPAPYDGFRMVEVGDPFGPSWRSITDGKPPPAASWLEKMEANEGGAERWCRPWPADPRLSVAAAAVWREREAIADELERRAAEAGRETALGAAVPELGARARESAMVLRAAAEWVRSR